VVVFDSDLDHVLDREIPITSVPERFRAGGVVLFDDNGWLYVGTIPFDSSFTQQTPDAPWGVSEGGFFDGSGASPGFYFPMGDNVSTDSWRYDYFRYNVFPSIVVDTGSGGTVISGGGKFYGRTMGVFHNRRNDQVAWYLQSDDGSVIHGVYGGAADFMNTLSSQELSLHPSFFTIATPGYVNDLWHTRDGVVIRADDEDELQLYDFSGNKKETYDLRGTEGGDRVQFSFSTDGKSWYILDREQEVLMKARTWW
jgi:hypothetical protein